MKILYLHGWHSVTGGVKPRFLESQGNRVHNPALDDDSFDAALATAQAVFDSKKIDVIVGASRGGAVAMNMRSGATPLVLLCPAWKRWGSVHRIKPNSLILHSRLDEVIPFEQSEELLRLSGLPEEQLIEVGTDHRLADQDSLEAMNWACRLLTTEEWHEKLHEFSEYAPKPNLISQLEAAYLCDACGEEIVIPLDVTEGESQVYVEDCPVCCHPNVIHVELTEDGKVNVRAEPEQDRAN